MNGEGRETGREEAAEALEALKQALSDCQMCGLCGGRTQVVFGVGDARASLMFVGEGPGFHEDQQGEPFVGQAGKLLTELLAGIGLSRGDVYIANVVKCRPPENRDPTPDEIEACSPHLMRQIEVIRPRVICTLGRFATKLLADTELSITAIHGKAKEKEFRGVSTLLFPVFHPAAALYAPANRKILQDDFAKLRVLLERGVQALGTEDSPDEPAAGPDAPTVIATAPLEATATSARQAERTEQLPLW